MASRIQGALAGMAGGIVGTAALNWFLKKTSRWVKQETPPIEDPYSMSLVGRQRREGESSTAAVGRLLYTRLRHREPDERTREKLSAGVDWTFGVAMAGLYGLVRGETARPDVLGGLLFGVALWVAADELAQPLLGLSAKPQAYPPSVHVQAAAGHLVYGAATAATMYGLDRLVEQARA